MILLLSILCRETCLLVSWCVDDMCDMTRSDENLGRSRGPGVEDRVWSSTIWVAGRLGGRVTPCAVCIMHKDTGSTCFLI
jgi:hypothetical protein